jgi:hypothetical protein
MSALQGLKLVAAKRVVHTPVNLRRHKLAKKLQEQLDLVTARQEGRMHIATRVQWRNDPDTGARVAVEVPKRTREWFWTADTGKINANVRYGTNTLTLGRGGKNAIEVADLAELHTAFTAIKQAVLDGELDDAIAEASVKTRKGFGK